MPAAMEARDAGLSADAGKQALLNSAAFAAYKEAVSTTVANPPETTEISTIVSTRT